MEQSKSTKVLQSLFRHYLYYDLAQADTTVKGYLNDCNDFFKFLNGRDFTLVDHATLVEYMQYLKNNHKSIETILRRLAGVRHFYNFLKLESAMKNNPFDFITLPRKGFRLPIFFDVKEIDLIVGALGSSPKDQRDKLIIETLYASGIRVSELINLKLCDFFIYKGVFKVTGKGNKERFVPIYKGLLLKIKAWLSDRSCYFTKKVDSGYLFVNKNGYKLSRQYIWKMIKLCCHKSGIGKSGSPHTLRHCFATHLLMGGADIRTIQIFLGHEDVVTTQIYTHISDTHKREVLERFHPRFKTSCPLDKTG